MPTVVDLSAGSSHQGAFAIVCKVR